jgi:chromosome partitioning protein
MIILVGGEKGGTGKTTIATNLALMRMQRDGEVLLVDADPQPTATTWCSFRDHNNHLPRILSVQKTGKSTASDIKSLADKYKNIVIDTGGRDTVEMRAGLLISDIAIIPLRPSQFDLWTLSKFNLLVGEVKSVNPRLRVMIFLNQIKPNPAMKEAEQAREFFNASEFENLTLADSVIYDRIVFSRAAREGKTVHELQVDPKSENELEALYKEVFND